jgi:hypothetical protein
LVQKQRRASVSALRDEISVLGGSLSRLVNRDEVLALIDKHQENIERAIEALGGYVGDEHDRGYDEDLGNVLAVLRGEPMPHPVKTPALKPSEERPARDTLRSDAPPLNWGYRTKAMALCTQAIIEAIDANTAAIREARS